MSSNIPQTLKGFRDFLPAEKRQRDFVTSKLIETFTQFGFEPLETPTLEYASLLLGKYGDEADKLVYTFTDQGDRQIGLRYDQTVPTARILAQYASTLPRCFRRYQIQNVFRADKPQRGRYREFTQCDFDIFGSSSPVSDAEIVACTYASFKNIGFPTVKLRINDRQVLFSTLEPFASNSVSVFSIIQSIDKLDKISQAEVIQELVKKGLRPAQASSTLEAINKATVSSDLQSIIETATSLGVLASDIEFSPFLARGLDYYTGMIFEVYVPEYGSGSCGGGGRYDQLIEQLGGSAIPAVGIALGFDRIVEAALQLGLIPSQIATAQVMVTIFDASLAQASTKLAYQLRSAGIATELYPAFDKLDKQLKAADQKMIPFVIILGDEEVEQKTVVVKNMKTGKQRSVPLQDLDASIFALNS